DLDTLRLDQPTHDVDRRVVAVEQAGRSDEPQRRGLGRRFTDGKIASGRAHGGYAANCLKVNCNANTPSNARKRQGTAPCIEAGYARCRHVSASINSPTLIRPTYTCCGHDRWTRVIPQHV